MVLHSGNHEIIGIRHRKTQTLYISHVIEPHSCSNPAYGKVQVGIYIAAIQDTIDRAMQGIEAREKSGRDPPADISLKDEEANLDGDPGDHPEGPTGSNKRNGSSGSKGEPQGKDEGKGKRPASRRVIDHPRRFWPTQPAKTIFASVSFMIFMIPLALPLFVVYLISPKKLRAMYHHLLPLFLQGVKGCRHLSPPSTSLFTPNCSLDLPASCTLE